MIGSVRLGTEQGDDGRIRAELLAEEVAQVSAEEDGQLLQLDARDRPVALLNLNDRGTRQTHLLRNRILRHIAGFSSDSDVIGYLRAGDCHDRQVSISNI